ncbi:hypothetical protein MMC19_004757 [Ptychographa xylographoides]|nr:hypothetical protein [Ptychographa xylographoides]
MAHITHEDEEALLAGDRFILISQSVSNESGRQVRHRSRRGGVRRLLDGLRRMVTHVERRRSRNTVSNQHPHVHFMDTEFVPSLTNSAEDFLPTIRRVGLRRHHAQARSPPPPYISSSSSESPPGSPRLPFRRIAAWDNLRALDDLISGNTLHTSSMGRSQPSTYTNISFAPPSMNDGRSYAMIASVRPHDSSHNGLEPYEVGGHLSLPQRPDSPYPGYGLAERSPLNHLSAQARTVLDNISETSELSGSGSEESGIII